MSRWVKWGIIAGALVVLAGGGVAAYRFLPWFGRAQAPVPSQAARPGAEAPAQAQAPAAQPAAVAAAAERPSPPTEPRGEAIKGPVAPVAAMPGTRAEDVGGAPQREREADQLIRLYEGMRPKDAAAVMSQLDSDLSTTILLGMRERQAAKILGLLPSRKAADLTMRMARTKRGKGDSRP